MPLPAVAVVVMGVGAVTSLIGTGMVMHEQSEARKANMEMLKQMMGQNQQRQQMLGSFLKQGGYGNIGNQFMMSQGMDPSMMNQYGMQQRGY